MALSSTLIVFGLTGTFGSGCSSFASALELAESPDLRFKSIRISSLIEDEWRKQHGSGQGDLLIRQPTREELQNLGDTFRHSLGHGYWAQCAIEQLTEHREVYGRIVIDGLRNPGEADFLRERFVNFYLIAVDAPISIRWKRLSKHNEWTERPYEDFLRLASRDSESAQDYGQQVRLCVDQADYVVTNDETRDPPKIRSYLRQRAFDLLNLASGQLRRPTLDEFYMHLAYSSSSGSACVKRNVGAIIVRPGESRTVAIDNKLTSLGRTPEIVAVGYNENPDGMNPCYIEYEACFRDIWMDETLQRIRPQHCPSCGTKLTVLAEPFVCPAAGCRASLINYFFPERAMTHCTAIHAEERAIINARSADTRGCHMYATTFPCFLCAEKIVQANIARVVYVEPYPDDRAEEFLRRRGVELERFDGVKSRAYQRFFSQWRANAEQRYSPGLTRLPKGG